MVKGRCDNLKKVLVAILTLIISINLTSCTPRMTENEYTDLEMEVQSKMKDVISYVETNLAISEKEESRQIIVDYIESIERELQSITEQPKGKIPKDKKEAFKSITITAEGGMLLISSYLGHGYESDTKEDIDDILKGWKKITNYDDSDNIWADNPSVKKSFETSIEEYMTENNIVLSWKDIQYDMSNNLDKEFIVAGTAELSDYYNYGFKGREGDYFCVSITPYDGKYSNRWHLYFHRESFEKLFNSLKEGNRRIITTCEIPDFIYKEGQGNMAFVNQAQW